MSQGICHIALCSGDREFALAWCQALREQAAREPVQGLACEFDAVFDAAALQQQARDDGCLQAVVIDGASVPDAAQLGAQLKGLRAELDLFLMVGDSPDGAELFAGRLDRRDDNVGQLLRQLRSAVGQRASTPFADTLRDYVYSARDGWHTPGHSAGASLRDSPWVGDFYQMMGEHVFNTDLSVSVQVLDSLLAPSSVIQDAQDLAARAFGARRTFFVTNGTSTANKVIVQHLLGAGGKIILDQACHKSIHHAVILYGAEPVYLPASVKEVYGFYGPVPRQRIIDAIDAHPDAKLLVLTSCTYDGFYYDLVPLVEYAHQCGMKVLIDEAWYAHGRFHPELRPNALESGADYVTQSSHKMLSAFSQASMIHVNDPDFDEHRFREHLNMHTSTSPQYAMIASLDVARKQMSMEGYAQLARCIDVASRLRQGINAGGVFRVLELADMLPQELLDDDIRLDPTKLSIDVSSSGMTARQVQLALFEQHGIQIEKITANTLTVLVTLGATESKLLRLLNALDELARSSGDRAPAENGQLPLPPLSDIRALPREAYFGASEVLALGGAELGINPQLVGRISADQVVPYPPGIPVLVPGQLITTEIARYLVQLHRANNGSEIHGLLLGPGDPGLRVSISTGAATH